MQLILTFLLGESAFVWLECMLSNPVTSTFYLNTTLQTLCEMTGQFKLYNAQF